MNLPIGPGHFYFENTVIHKIEVAYSKIKLLNVMLISKATLHEI